MTETLSRTAIPAQSPAPRAHATDPFVPIGGRIVVGIDGSSASLQALRTASRIAEITGAVVEAVAVWETPLTFGYPEVAGSGWSPEEDCRAMLKASVQDVFDGKLPADLRTSVRFGSPARQILRQAEGASLIVLGNRGHGGLTGLLLGSVSTKCAAAARCPVLIVHSTEPIGG
jgi:nucleotide-binding universal stress UspA family protein